MKILKFQSTIFCTRNGERRKCKSNALYIPCMEKRVTTTKSVVFKGCQKMNYPECIELKDAKMGNKSCVCPCKGNKSRCGSLKTTKKD